jgi:hypothetical protein
LFNVDVAQNATVAWLDQNGGVAVYATLTVPWNKHGAPQNYPFPLRISLLGLRPPPALALRLSWSPPVFIQISDDVEDV